MKQTNKKTIQQGGTRKRYALLLLFLSLLSYSGYSQTTSGVALNWNSYVGCQTFGEIRERDGKDPVLIDDIIDGHCITVCRDSNVTYTLSGSLAANPNTTWTVTGGTITGQGNTYCAVHWVGLGGGTLTLTTTSLTGVVTKTICFEKVEIPSALFTVAPFTNVESDLYGCSMQTIYFNNLSTTNGGSGLYSYYWSFGDGDFSTAFAPTHIYTNDGTYEVMLIVTNSCGCSSRFAKKIKIGKRGFDISCPSVVCEGQTTSYSLPFDGREFCHDHYNWSVNGGSFVPQNDGTVDVTWDHVGPSGFGTVTFDPSDCNLSCGLISTIRIPVIQTNGTIVGNNTTCLGSQERYVLPQWPATIFTWSVVGNSGNSLANVIHTDQRNEVIIQPNVSGDIVLRCTYQNTLLHCGGTAEFTIHVTNVMAINGPSTVCQNSIGFYNIPSGENSSWTLKNSNNITVATSGSSNTFSYNFTAAGTYTLSIAGSPNCPSSALTITVVPTPSAAPSITGALVECPNAPYTYSVPGSNTTGVYQWAVTGGTFTGPNTGNSVVITFNNNASHTVTVTNQTQNPIQCNSAPVSITVNKQTIDAGISAANGDICANTNQAYQAIKFGILPETLFTDCDSFSWSIWNATNSTAMPSLGSITSGQGTNSINVLWNNVTTLTTATLRVTIQKCNITLSFTKLITIKPVAQIAVNASVDPVCSGSQITFNVVSTNGVTLDPATVVNWNFGNGNTPTGGLSITTSYTNTSSANIGRNVTATIVNPNGCIGNSVSPIKVITVLPAPNAAVSITSGGNAFCPPATINTVLTATVTSGATIQWRKSGNSTVYGTGPSLSVTNAMGYGSYYIIATNAALCSTTSNHVDIVQFCAPGECTISPAQTVTNDSDLGCFAPTTVADCNCGIINLVGTASGSPLADYWTIIGPNPANSYNNYTGTSIGTVGTPLEPGDYNIFHHAAYLCTDGQTGIIGAQKKVTVPYVANFSYSVECNGTNYDISLVDTSPYYAPVDNRTFTYYTGTSATGPWTLAGSTASYTITNQGTGNHYIRLVITGDLNGTPQTPCEKIRLVNIATSPVPSITASVIPVKCHDSSIHFDISGTPPSGYTYLWTFDGGATNTLQNPDRVFTNSGSQTVYLEIKNKYGCVITPAAQLQYVLNIPNKCFNGTVTSTPSSASVCSGNTVTLQYAPAGDFCPVSSYTWMKDSSPLGITTPTVQVGSEGFYWVKVESASPNSCKYETPNRITPVFKPLPTLETTPLPTYCQGVDVPISITTNATSILWTIDGSLYTVFNNMSSITIPGNWGFGPMTHPISVTVTSAQGCSKTATFGLTIAAAPATPVITSSLVSCNPYTVELTATGTSGFYNWSNGASGSNTITVLDGGPYEVTVSAGGCTSRSQTDVPKSPEDYLWVFPSGCFKGCSNSLATVIGPSVLPVEEWSWEYDHHQVVSGHDATPPFDLTNSGVYNLTLNTGLCSQTSNDLNYTMVDCKECPLEVRIEKLKSLDSPFCSVTMDLYITNSSGAALPITVMCPNNEVIVSANSFVALPGLNVFHVTVTPINGFNGGTLALFIRGFDTKKNELCNTPVMFDMPDCHPAGKMQGLGAVNTNSLLIAPNPSKGLTNISFSYSTAPVLEVYTLLGQKVAGYTAESTKGSWELTTASLPSGVYIVVMKENGIVLMQKKLMVE